MPRPAGFFDPKNPAGEPTPPETEGNGGPGRGNAAGNAADGAASSATPAAPSAAQPEAAAGGRGGGRGGGAGLNFANSDLAFSRNRLVQGNFNGFNTYDIDSATKPRLVASTVCPGGQGDVSIYGHLLFMSVEQTRGRVDCGTQGIEAAASPDR